LHVVGVDPSVEEQAMVGVVVLLLEACLHVSGVAAHLIV
jgi:hypothetical protein